MSPLDSRIITAVIFLIGGVNAAELCEGERVWYDIVVGLCRPCVECELTGGLELIPCTLYENAVCFDMRQLEDGLVAVSSGSERLSSDNGHHSRNSAAMATTVDKSGRSLATANSWNVASVVLCSLLALVALVIIVAVVLKFRNNRTRKRESRMLSTRARLFSRDRLDTTEYMNNLATLDRKLAMDEILEKRRRVIFTPTVACDTNLDEVFIGGLALEDCDEQTNKLITIADNKKWTGLSRS